MLLFLLFNWCFITVFREDSITPTCLFCSMEWILLEISSLLSNCGRSTINRAMKYHLTHQVTKMEGKLKVLIWDYANLLQSQSFCLIELKILRWYIERIGWTAMGKIENLLTWKHSLCYSYNDASGYLSIRLFTLHSVV